MNNFIKYISGYCFPITLFQGSASLRRWEDLECIRFKSSSILFLSLFALLYVFHYFYIDIPAKKEPLELYFKYRFGLAGLCLVSSALIYKSNSNNISKIPLIITGFVVSYFQSQSMIWRDDILFYYSLLLPVLYSMFLRVGPFLTFAFVFFCYALQIEGFLKRPNEYRHIFSSGIIGLIFSTAYSSKLRADILAFFIMERNEKIQSQLSEQKLNEVKLKAAKDAEIAKLATQVAHDIRSPVMALSAATATLPDSAHDQRDLIQNSINRINQIANDLLSKYKKPVVEIQPQANNTFLSIFDLLITEKRAQYAQLDIHFKTNIEKSIILPVQIPVEDLTRVFSNLLNNAIDSLPQLKGEVSIDVHADTKNITVKIQDNGKGIAPEILNQLGSRGTTFNKSEGTGLGLAHAKEFVESHQGDFEIKSIVGTGTAVIIRLQNQNPHHS